ncbi:hypothetical protein HMI49_14245 [Corallococcus exercitus]|uniref:NACHT domain-containing protein n=1 Tax=Corallococcus exercitus TaxID=2316736 RepID=A0A7Y4KID6_9BACT|nr:hypothetical protein [Corallococcus exercitus]NOK34360.1 hypothetical protein [Corallococcus exercitus]
MPHYDLQTLEPRTFQQLVQALAVKEIGPGLIPYGDGADGARDALFQGTATYPSSTSPWSGTLLLQVKFRQKPSSNPQKEGDWLISQAKKDIKKLGTSKKYILPDHYVLATNIDLTPVPNVGTDARARSALQELCREMKIKNFDIWDGNKIKRLLDSHREISITYGGYITTGDVLLAMRNQIAREEPNFEQTISEYLQHELLTDQYARLREAGSASDRKTSLSRVFVDLPSTSEPQSDPPDDTDTHGDFKNFAHEIIQTGALRMDRQSIINRREFAKQPNSLPSIENGRIVLIGGPGQGKSTLGQFICQLYRTALLKDRNKATLSESALDTINIILPQCSADKISLPKTRRFPIRIDLKNFADELANEKCNSVIEYIARKIDSCATAPINKSTLQTWLKSYPWILIFDGLDEVPASGNRANVLDCINQFITQCATLEADVLIIATSRPQGYGEAFPAHIFCHRYLCPLDTKRALHYAKRLTEACHPGDPALQKEIQARLDKAAAEQTTKKLMQSPLQVTILSVLAELSGELPKDRWDLFSKYYNTIFNRETQRGLSLSSVLRDHKQAIDRIHRQVGLQLQIASEAAGKNDAVLPKQSFSRIVRNEIEDSIIDPTVINNITDRITEAALDRLVFLVSPREQEIGFEIRSLQEFMAAEALMDGSDSQIISRLESIAGIPYWRNVFLFAAGRCSTERRYLVSHIVNVCQTLNDISDPSTAITRSGSRLALDLIEDDTFRTQPRQHRALAEIAQRLLELPPEDIHIRLANACLPQRGLEQIYKLALERSLSLKNTSQQLAAWQTASWIPPATHPWIVDFLNQHWPKSTAEQLQIIRLLENPYVSPWLASKSLELTPHSSPSDIPARNPTTETPQWVTSLRRIVFNRLDARTIKLQISTQSTNLIPLSINPFRPTHPRHWLEISKLPTSGIAWSLMQSNARLLLHPTREQAATELNSISNFFSKDSSQLDDCWHWGVAWPLLALLTLADNKEDLKTFARQLETGAIQPPSHWLQLESLWEKGISYNPKLSEPTTAEEALTLGWRHGKFEAHSLISNSVKSNLTLLTDALKSTTNKTLREIISTAIIHDLRVASGRFHDHQPTFLDVQIQPADFVEIIDATNGAWVGADMLAVLVEPDNLTTDWIDALNTLGSSTRKLRIHQHAPFRGIEKYFIPIAKHYASNPRKTGLLSWLLAFAQAGAAASEHLATLPIDSSTPEHEAQSLLLRLAGGDIRDQQVSELATRISNCSQTPAASEKFYQLGNILQPHLTTRWAEQLLIQIHNGSGALAPITIELILQLIRNRKSSLHNEKHLAALGLKHVSLA